MNGKDKTMFDSSGRFKTDKNFKNTIIKNCSRLRQRSTDDHYSKRNNTIKTNIDKIRRITNFKKLSSLKENFMDSKEINNISKDNLSIDMNINLPEKRERKILRSNLRKAFFIDFNFENKRNNEIKKEGTSNFSKNNSFIEVNKNKMIEKNNIVENNENVNNKNQNKNENINNKRLSIRTKNISKYDTNDGIKELVIDIKDNNNFTRSKCKRSNSIRRIMNNFYYHSYTTEKKKVSNTKINNEQSININTDKDQKIENNYHCIPHNKKYNSVFNNNLYNEGNNTEKIVLNGNSSSSYVYKRKKKKFGNILNSNNCVFNTYSTEDNSFINNDNNKDSKKNIETQNKNLIKVKIVYQKPNKRAQIAKEVTSSDINISINQTINRPSKRRKILFERKIKTDYESIKGDSIEKNRQENLLTPSIRYNKEKNLNISSKDTTIKRRFDRNDIKHIDNNILNINIENEKNNNDNFIIEFFDDIIELCNSIEEKTILEILTKNINKKYIIDYNQLLFEKIYEIKDNFEYCFKYFCIIIITLYFLLKDEILYKYNSVKIHLLFIQYIYSSLCYIGYQDLNSKNIKRFFREYHFKKKVSIIQCTTSIIKLLFDEKEEYSSLNNVLKQLMVNTRTTKVEDITKIINQTILFCFNTKSKGKNPFTYFKQKNSSINNINNNYITVKNEENNKNEEKYPLVPFIRTTMRKKFCLVLDLDETISHSLKLNFGYYFLLRPGVIEFLTELSELYEIIIFTSSPKIYADSIIDKIDENGNLISHRLYKPHVIFEKGKSVKKLNLIGRDLNKIIFVDNMKCNAKYNPKNLYLIPSWTDDIYDDELFKLKNKLKYIYSSGKFNDDITKAL